MKLGLRIFICNLVIFAACFYFPLDWLRETQRTRYLEGVEEPLVDVANILASLVEEGDGEPRCRLRAACAARLRARTPSDGPHLRPREEGGRPAECTSRTTRER